jgi:hypothetical protein
VASFTYEFFINPSLARAASGGWPAKLGFANVGAGNFPEIDFGAKTHINGYWEDPIGYSSSGYYDDNNYIYDDTLTWIRGRHTLKFGGEVRTFEINSHGGLPTLTFNFTNAQTGAPTQKWSNEVGFGFASFLLGGVSSAGQGTPYDLYGRRKSMSLFAEDSFRVGPRLTLNYGLNWNQTYPYHEEYGHWASFDTAYKDPTTGMPGRVAYLNNGGQSFEGSTQWTDFAPHIGFAYKINSRIVARGAYAIFYVPIGTDTWEGVPYAFAPGYFPTNQVPQTKDFTPAFNWDSGYPGKPVSGTLDPNYLTLEMVSTSPQSLQSGMTNQWNAGVQIQLTGNNRISLNYLSTRGTHLHDGTLQENEPPLSAMSNLLKSGNEWNWVWDQKSAAASGVSYPYPGFSNYAFAAIYPFPQLAGAWDYLFYINSPLGRSQYDSFQAEVVQRLSHGLTADMSYALAHQRYTTNNNFQENWVTTTLVQNPYDLSYAGNYVQPYNQSILKGYLLYDLPFGKGRRFASTDNRWLNGLIKDWTLGTTLYYSTGYPLSIYSSNYYPGPSWGANGVPTAIYSNVAPGADLSRHFNARNFNPSNTVDPGNRYFNPAGFSNPAYGDFGNSGPWVVGLNTFGNAAENLAVYKEFHIKERMKFQIRGEFFNVFNRHYFDDPNTNLGDTKHFGNVMTVGGTPRVGQLGARFEW